MLYVVSGARHGTDKKQWFCVCSNKNTQQLSLNLANRQFNHEWFLGLLNFHSSYLQKFSYFDSFSDTKILTQQGLNLLYFSNLQFIQKSPCSIFLNAPNRSTYLNYEHFTTLSNRNLFWCRHISCLDFDTWQEIIHEINKNQASAYSCVHLILEVFTCNNC